MLQYHEQGKNPMYEKAGSGILDKDNPGIESEMRVTSQDLCIIIFDRGRYDQGIGNPSTLHSPPDASCESCNFDIDRDYAALLFDLQEHLSHFHGVASHVSLQFRNRNHRGYQLFSSFEKWFCPLISLPEVDPRPGIENDNDLNPLRGTRTL